MLIKFSILIAKIEIKFSSHLLIKMLYKSILCKVSTIFSSKSATFNQRKKKFPNTMTLQIPKMKLSIKLQMEYRIQKKEILEHNSCFLY